MRTNNIFYSFLLACGLALSYWASLPEGDDIASNSIVFSLGKDKVKDLVYETKENRYHIFPQKGTERYWVALSSKTETKSKEDVFLASESLSSVFKLLSPLKVEKEIGVISDSQKESFGLVDDADLLTIKTEGQDSPYKLKVGVKSYGARSLYVLDLKTKRVFLVSDKAFSILKSPKNRLFSRKISLTDILSLSQIKLSMNGKELSMYQVSTVTKKGFFKDDKLMNRGPSFWADSEKAKSGNQTYLNWIKKVQKLRILSYADAEMREKLSKEPLVLSMEWFDKSGLSEKIQVKKHLNVLTSKLSYFLFSNYTKTWAEVSANRMESIEKDALLLVE